MAEANIVIRLSDGRQAGQTLKELRQDANRLTREINNLKPGSDAFIKKTEDLRKVSGRMSDVRKEIKGVSNANDNLMQGFAQYVPFGAQVQNLAGGFKMLTGATNMWRMALVAIPLIALISLVIKAVHWFTQTQAAMDKITSVTRPLNAVFQRFIGLMQELVGGLFAKFQKAIDNPKQALIDLGDAIRENVLNRLEAFSVMGQAIVKIINGDLKEGFAELGNGVIQATTGIEDGITKVGEAAQATKKWVNDGLEAGTRLDELQKQIERTEINLAKNRALLNEEYQKAKEVAQDLSADEDVRLAAARKAQEAQNKLVEMEQHFLDLKIEKMRLEQTLNDTSRADELELAKLEAERTEFSAQAARKRASAKALENTINKQIATEEAKRQKEIQKAFEERLKKEEEARRNMEDLAIEIMDEGLEKEIAQITLETERKIEALVGSEEQIREQQKLLEQQKQQEIAAIKDEYRAEELEKEQKAKEEKIAIDQEIMEAKMGIYENTAAAATGAYDTMVALFGKESAAAKAANALRKAMLVAEVKAQVQQQLAAADVAGAKIQAIAPPVTIPLGIAYTIAAKIAAVAGGAKQVAEISKLEKGGILRGKRHYAGGIPGYIMSTGEPIEMEDGEIVLNRNVGLSPVGRRAASDLNAAFGGKRFELGGIVNPFRQEAVSTTGRSSEAIGGSTINLTSTNERLDRLNNEFAMFREDISTWARNLKVNNNLQETQDGINTLNRLSNEAGL